MSILKKINEILKTDSSAIILDARMPHEYITSHLCNAKLLQIEPHQLTVFQYVKIVRGLKYILTLNNVKSDDPIIVYCKLGKRSGVVSDILKKMGYTNVYNLGGILNGPLGPLFAAENIGQRNYSHLHVCFKDQTNVRKQWVGCGYFEGCGWY